MALQPDEQLVERLRFIWDRAGALSLATYDQELGIPANVSAEAERLRQAAATALHAIERGDHAEASLSALDAGKRMESLNKSMAIYSGLQIKADLQKPRSEGGKSTAKRKQAEEQDEIDDTRRRWEKLASEGKPERERAGIIARQKGKPANTVRGWIRKAGLR